MLLLGLDDFKRTNDHVPYPVSDIIHIIIYHIRQILILNLTKRLSTSLANWENDAQGKMLPHHHISISRFYPIIWSHWSPIRLHPPPAPSDHSIDHSCRHGNLKRPKVGVQWAAVVVQEP